VAGIKPAFTTLRLS